MLSSNLTPEDWISGAPAKGSTRTVENPFQSSGGEPKPSTSSDSLFDSLILQESGGKQFDANGNPLTSKKGAVGLAQVMRATAPEAAALAGLPFDENRWRNDGEYNKAIGRAYFDKQLQDFGGDPEKALAAYNAGPGAVRLAIKKADASGNPASWKTLLPAETRAYIPSVMAKAGYEGGAAPEYYSPKKSNLVAYEPDNSTFFDRVAGGFKKGIDQSLGLAASSAALINRSATGEIDNDFQKSAMEFAQKKQEDAARHSGNAPSFSSVVTGDGSFSHWLGDSLGYLAYQVAESLATGGAGALIGKSVGKEAVASVASNMIAKEADRILATEAGKKLAKQEVANLAAKNVAKELAAGTALFANNLRQEAGGIYQDALKAEKEDGRPVDLTKAWLASLGATAVDTAADVAAAKGLFGRGASSAPTLAGRAATQLPRQMGIQGGTESTQSLIENWGAGEDPFTKKNLIQALDEGAVGALGGIAPGVGSSIRQAPPRPELKPVLDKAKESNSPLSKAAAEGIKSQPVPTELPEQKDPAQRLAELEAIGRGTPDQTVMDDTGAQRTIPGTPGRFFTPEEKSEYDQLIALRDATPGIKPEDQKAKDEIFDRAKQIEQAISTNNGLTALRQEDSPVDTKQFLNDLALAKSKSTAPALREQALARLEFAASWMGLDLTAPVQQQERQLSPEAKAWQQTRPAEQPGAPTAAQSRASEVEGILDSTQGLSAQDRQTAVAELNVYRNRSLPEKTRQAALSRALEIVGRTQAPVGQPAGSQTPAVLGDIQPQPNTPEHFEREAKRREDGAYQFRSLGYDEEANALLAEADSLREMAASARAGELGMELSAQDDADIASPVQQQTVAEATQNLPRVQIPAATGQETGAEGTAARRKRKAQLQQLAAAGFDTVERRGAQSVFKNTKTGQEVILDSAADAQLARQAIKTHVDAKANTAAASPQNDRLEPTEAQIKAGNYKKSDVIDTNGVQVVIENPAGSTRRGTSPDGKAWETKLQHHYGEIVGSEGADGDRVDVFIGPRPDSNRVFVIDQVNPDGSFDEHKLVFGATSEDDARQIYLSNYEPGWTGLGGIREIKQSDLKAWLKNHDNRPASEEVAASGVNPEEGAGASTVTVNFDGQSHVLPTTSIERLPSDTDSAARGGRRRRISKKQALILKAVANFFGKDVVFFSDPNSEVNADGFIKSDDSVTIFINETSGISPIAVLGHELMHLLRRDNPAAYDAIAKVVRSRVADAKGFRSDYYGKYVVTDANGSEIGTANTMEQAQAMAAKVDGAKVSEQSSAELNDADMEELISDLNGNLMTDEKFWGEVFEQIKRDNGQQAHSIIVRLAAFLQNLVQAAKEAFKGQKGFDVESFVSDMDAVREAMRKSLAEYAKTRGNTQQAMQAEILRAQQDIKRSTPKFNEQPKPVPDDALTLEAYHYSKQPRQFLTTAAYGTGLKGSDRDSIMQAQDRRLSKRLYFYANKGTGVRPEQGVGGIAHKATLTGIYDADADVKRLRQGADRRAFESAVLDAGYKGYLSRLDGTQPAQVILLGNQTVNAEVLGPRDSIPEAAMVPPMAKRTADLADQLQAVQIPLNGQLKLERWAQLLAPRNPALFTQLQDAGVFDGDGAFYKDELVARVRAATSSIKRSAKRAKDEYAEVEKRFKDTDQWLMAPNGKPTKLTERQWVQVRTPSFKSWFGDWEAALENGGVWAVYDVSKVVDENGEPLVVYHGTDRGGFMEFEEPTGSGRGDLGVFATDNWDMARSYVRKNRAQQVQAPAETSSQQDLENLGFRFVDEGGRVTVEMPWGDEGTYRSADAAIKSINDDYQDELDVLLSSGPGSQPGVYALFLNIRDPNESSFDGAYWNGERIDQWQVMGADGEQIYFDDGRAYFDRETAEQLAEENDGATVERADDHYETTDSVVEDARRFGNDGAIIRQVIDDGGGPGSYMGEPADVFVAFKPEQIKSADFNGGEFSPDQADIRRSARRPQDPSVGDKTDVSKLPDGKAIPESAAIGGLESSLELARSKSYRRGRELKQDIQQRVLAAARAARVDLSDRTKATYEFLKRMVTADAKFALKSNENAVGWYDQKVSRAIGALSTIHPEIDTDPRSRLAFLWALATTSNGLKVDKNFELAERAYRAWKQGGVMPDDVGIGNAAKAINKGMGIYNELSKKIGDERLLKFMSTTFGVGEIARMLGIKVGGEWSGTPVRGAAILGPKIGNGFFSNLNGYFDALTMDRWLMRTWGRMTGTLLETDQKEIAKTRKKLAAAIAAMDAKERKTFSGIIGKSLKSKMTKAELDAVATASQKASMKVDKREQMMSSEAMNDLRKAAILHHMTMDGQKEAPNGPAERNWIRAVFQGALDQLRADGYDMTMSDLQALLWYPERRLYDAAKSDEDVANGYEDDEAPDYANAAMNLAISSGVPRVSVMAAMDAAEARGTVKGETLSDDERAAMLKEFVQPPKQQVQFAYEVAPDPANPDLVAAWEKFPLEERQRITKLVKDAILADVIDTVGAKVGKTVMALGGYMGLINPNLLTEFKHTQVSIEQARALAAAIGMALSQDSVALVDPRAQYSAGMVRITLSTKAEKLAPKLFRAIAESIPEVDAFTARGNNFDVLNFTGMSTEELAGKIEDAIQDVDEDVEAQISFGEVKSELIEKADYESHIEGLRPGSGGEILQRVERARYRAQEIVAGEIRRAVEVPGSAGTARRDAAGSEVKASRDRDREGRDQSGGLAPLEGAPVIQGATGPDPRLVQVADDYARQNGIDLRRQAEYVKVDPERAKRIAAAYEAMPHAPQDARVKEAYENLIRQTVAQYRALEQAGYRFYLHDETNDPYQGNPWNAMRDLRTNQVMGVFATEAGFGTNADFDPAENPLLADTGIRWPWGSLDGPSKRVLANDLFRAVHDAFGHGLEGAGFRAQGEENAWQAHIRMFTGSAKGAITSETRGQNSWLNYGPYGDGNRTAKVEDTVFADQKTGLMPEWTWTDGLAPDAEPEVAADYNQRIEAIEELIACLKK